MIAKDNIINIKFYEIRWTKYIMLKAIIKIEIAVFEQLVYY